MKEIVIKIDEGTYNNFVRNEYSRVDVIALHTALTNGTPLKTGHCEDCKYFRILPHHANTLGKCIQHTGLCPKSDWYCADYEPQESEVRND